MPSPTREESEGETGQAQDGATDCDGGERGTGGRLACALEMEMTNRSLLADSKVNCVHCDGLINRNGGDSAEVSVPLCLPGKRTAHMEGDELHRLRDRKFLLEDRKRLCALSLGTALLGILLMIIHSEICPFVYKTVGFYTLMPLTSICTIWFCKHLFVKLYHYSRLTISVSTVTVSQVSYMALLHLII